MKRVTATLAIGLALAVAAYAQDTKTTTTTTTKSSGGDVKTMTYTGCVITGTQANSYVLNKVMPVSRTTTVQPTGTAGAVATTITEYALVPDQTVTIKEHVGHKVEVTGVMIPAGEVKTETKTKVEREDAPD